MRHLGTYTLLERINLLVCLKKKILKYRFLAECFGAKFEIIGNDLNDNRNPPRSTGEKVKQLITHRVT